MYVLPFSMGPVGSAMSQIGVQLTDSPYVVVSMRIMARIGLPIYQEIERGEKRVVPCMHSVGAPLPQDKRMFRGRVTLKSISFISRRLGKYGRMVPAMAATRCSGRNASHFGLRRP